MAGMRARLYNFDGWQRMVLCTIVSVWYPHDMLESNGVRDIFGKRDEPAPPRVRRGGNFVSGSQFRAHV